MRLRLLGIFRSCMPRFLLNKYLQMQKLCLMFIFDVIKIQMKMWDTKHVIKWDTQ